MRTTRALACMQAPLAQSGLLIAQECACEFGLLEGNLCAHRVAASRREHRPQDLGEKAMTVERSQTELPKFYDVREVADMFRMSRMTVYRAISTGELHAVRIRGRWLVPARVIEALADDKTEEGGR